MRTSSALAKRMQSLITSLHPPNPPTALESQQILGVLQKSFRKVLDNQHPHPATLRTKSSILCDSSVPHAASSSQATSDHFGSLLNHPILNPLIDPNRNQDAMHVFDQLMGESRIDLSRLMAIMQQHSRETMSNNQLSSRLDTWVRMADKASREAFFTNKSALLTAVEIVTKEGHEDILWKWLELTYGRDVTTEPLTSRVWLGVEDALVSRLMHLAIQRHNISEAAEQFVQACKYRQSSGRANPSPHVKTSTLPSVLMMRSAKRMATAIVFHRNQHGIPAASFDQVMKYLPVWAHVPTLNNAFCMLYHPTNPSADLLYSFIAQPAMAEAFMKTQDNARSASRRAVMTALLDASKLSLASGKSSQASLLLDFAIDRYPDFLPPRRLDAVEHQLWTSLSFALG